MPGKIIRLGDPTNHGGSVISASGPVVFGKASARVGDQVSCPNRGMASAPSCPVPPACPPMARPSRWKVSRPVAAAR